MNTRRPKSLKYYAEKAECFKRKTKQMEEKERSENTFYLELNYSEIGTLKDALNHYKRFMEAFGEDFNVCDGYGEMEVEAAGQLLKKVEKPMNLGQKIDLTDDDDLPF